MPDETDTTADPPTPLTHQDVVAALRERIINECADITGAEFEIDKGGMRLTKRLPGADLAGLAALVSAYNGTDARESAFNDNIRAVFDRVLSGVGK